ncbi:hypothetical protein ACIBG8_54540 [Nonomuraea sp. NPDC050556]|uniref:hypothetical protein n=1 Tax=Nonomuraea sp. NPDC050556 TaxID=3364369 RepID=UPI0037B3A9B4
MHTEPATEPVAPDVPYADLSFIGPPRRPLCSTCNRPLATARSHELEPCACDYPSDLPADPVEISVSVVAVEEVEYLFTLTRTVPGWAAADVNVLHRMLDWSEDYTEDMHEHGHPSTRDRYVSSVWLIDEQENPISDYSDAP